MSIIINKNESSVTVSKTKFWNSARGLIVTSPSAILNAKRHLFIIYKKSFYYYYYFLYALVASSSSSSYYSSPAFCFNIAMNFSLSSEDIPCVEQSPTPHSAPRMQYLFSISLRFLKCNKYKCYCILLTIDAEKSYKKIVIIIIKVFKL